MAGILALTTLMAVMFGLLRSVGAHPFVYVFVGVLALVTSLVQMRYGEVPRVASMVAGAIVMPICAVGFLIVLAMDERIGFDDISRLVCILPFLVALGAPLGYLAGASTAGLFLLIDLAESYFEGKGGRLRYARPVRPPPEPQYIVATIVERDPHAEAIRNEVRALMAADNPFAPARAAESSDAQPSITAETADRSAQAADEEP